MKEEKTILTFPALFNETVRKHGGSMAYSFAGEDPISYSEASEKIRGHGPRHIMKLKRKILHP
jgi:hypothetical protein